MFNSHDSSSCMTQILKTLYFETSYLITFFSFARADFSPFYQSAVFVSSLSFGWSLCSHTSSHIVRLGPCCASKSLKARRPIVSDVIVDFGLCEETHGGHNWAGSSPLWWRVSVFQKAISQDEPWLLSFEISWPINHLWPLLEMQECNVISVQCHKLHPTVLYCTVLYCPVLYCSFTP